jgi:hypothetical protein
MLNTLPETVKVLVFSKIFSLNGCDNNTSVVHLSNKITLIKTSNIMNLFTINHRLNNFATELNNIQKDAKVKMYTRNETQIIESRVIFLEEQIAILKEAKDEIKWNKALGVK